MDKLICESCESENVTAELREFRFPYGSGGDAVELVVNVPVIECKDCHLKCMDESAEMIKHNAICRHLGVQTPAEIVSIRERYDLSRASFCELTGIGIATLQRWESGSVVQNVAMDRYLRLLKVRSNMRELSNSQLSIEPVEEESREYSYRVLVINEQVLSRKNNFRLRQ